MVAVSSFAKPVRRTKVLVIDDSALIRTLLTEIIEEQPDMTVVGTASDPLIARQLIRELAPDVLTLDVEMPKMNGIDFLEKLMRLRPMPVVMVSSLTSSGSEMALRALELGAVDVVGKPRVDIKAGIEASAAEIVEKIRAAASSRPRDVFAAPPVRPKMALSAATLRHVGTRIIVIGASTGGTEAIKTLVRQLPAQMPGIVIAQHMPAGFTSNFAHRLDQVCDLTVKEAEDGEPVRPGHVYIAPGGRHVRVFRRVGSFCIELGDDAPVNRHRPSVDVLFRSIADCAGSSAIGVMLTGMGNDGALAMTEMRLAGAHNIAQNEETCVVYGMPREAVEAGGVDEVLPLDDIAVRLCELLKQS